MYYYIISQLIDKSIIVFMDHCVRVYWEEIKINVIEQFTSNGQGARPLPVVTQATCMKIAEESV